MLPSILEIAQQHGLQINDRYSSHSAKEIRGKCPFCGADANKNGKFYLSLNTINNLFKCWACGESGGVLKFIALLEEKSIEEVKRDLWGSNRSPRKLHPAEKLTPLQLRAMGFVGFNWGKQRKENPEAYKRTLNWIWSEWQIYSKNLKRMAYMGLLCAVTAEEIRSHCKSYAEQLGVPMEDLLLELTDIKFSHCKPDWAKSAEWFIEEARRSQKQVNLHQCMAG